MYIMKLVSISASSFGKIKEAVHVCQSLSTLKIKPKFSYKCKSFVILIRVNLLHPSPSLFLYGLLLSLWCFSVLVNYYFHFSFNLKAIIIIFVCIAKQNNLKYVLNTLYVLRKSDF